jgi:putative transposase
MRKSKLSEAQIFALLKEGEGGIQLDEICRKYGIALSTYHKYKSKFGGMEQSDLKKLKALEEENRRLKHMYAELSLDHKILKDIVEKKFSGR